MVAAWVLLVIVTVLSAGQGRDPVAPARSRAAGKCQEQPEPWASGPPWRLDETMLGISPRSGLLAEELGTGRAVDANGGDE